MNLSESYKNRLSELAGVNLENTNFLIVYRGEPINKSHISSDSIWVTPNPDFAKEYGIVKSYKLPKAINVLDTDYYDIWEQLVEEFDLNGDFDEYKYEPTTEFINFLKVKGYEGFQNGDNILIFDKSKLLQ